MKSLIGICALALLSTSALSSPAKTAATDAPSGAAANGGIAASSSCTDDVERKAKLDKKFLDNYQGGPAQQKVAYDAARKFLARYGNCPDEEDKRVADYLLKRVGKYEEAAIEFQRRRQ